ncbi:MAG: hypothetical protein RLZZ353_1268, partial [Actinomycetota bacterium]
MTRLLVLMGSGETTPTMVTTHQRILTAVGDGPAVVVDTPYGFQENADELTDRTLEYFARNVGREVGVVSLRDADAVGTVAREVALAAVGEAAWVFAGPGSPTYLARQWRAAGLPGVLAARLADERRTTATVLASAAACTAGRRTVPVYELYKVGEAPHWQDGLDLLRRMRTLHPECELHCCTHQTPEMSCCQHTTSRARANKLPNRAAKNAVLQKNAKCYPKNRCCEKRAAANKAANK